MDFKDACALLKKSTHIVIAQQPNADFDTAATIAALTLILAAEDKRIGFLHPITYLAELLRNAGAPDLGAQPPPLEECVIRITTDDAPPATVRYEKKENTVDIIVAPSLQPIRTEKIQFRKGRILCDCILAIAVDDLDAYSPPEDESDFFSRHQVITVIAGAPQRRIGAPKDSTAQDATEDPLNLIDPSASSTSEIVFSLLQEYTRNDVPPRAATLLFAGILSRTRQLSASGLNAENFETAGRLLRAGADPDAARALARSITPWGLIQIAARATVRSRADAAKNSIWFYLAPDDFAKTQTSAADLPAVAAYLDEHHAGRRAFFVLLAQPRPDDRIRAIILWRGDGTDNLRNLDGQPCATGVLLTEQFDDFPQAEDRISKLLAPLL
ncbi:MAG: hypothetical protein AAB539_01765 [Patescibacteria group bacterium]